MKNFHIDNVNLEEFIDELEFKTTRSSGKGGQHVNKVSSKVILIFNLWQSKILNRDQKQLVIDKLKKRISKNGTIQISSSKSRSQFSNKKDTIDKFVNLINKALELEIIRIETKPTKISVKQRKHNKLKNTEKKQSRKKVTTEE
jgi:ribosome-associated protein